MSPLIEIGLMNAPVALGLAVIVYLIGRFWKRPAILHALWVLVLVKLLMPPLIHVPLPWQLPAWFATSAPSQTPPGTPDGTVGSTAGADVSLVNLSLVSPGSSSELDVSFGQALVVGLLSVVRPIFLLLLCVWALGAIVWFCREGWRIVRFAQVFLRNARLAPRSTQRQAVSLARSMGMKTCPEVWLLSAVVSPMLWCVGGRARILFPTRLAAQLDKGAMATLLTHELAHYYRGDHWVRMLEFVVTGLFWWHPAVWMARREIEIHEEQCCDAWVVGQFPKAPRQYADALLATIDFLHEQQTILPAAASGLGDAPLIRQRLILIMRGAAPKSLGTLGRIIVFAMAVLVFVQPQLTTKAVSQPEQGPKRQDAAPNHASTRRPASDEQSTAASSLQRMSAIKSISQTSPITSRRQPPVSTRMMSPSAFQDSTNLAHHRAKSVKGAAPKSNWLVWARAIAPNMLSGVVAHDDGKVSWQHFCSEEATDLSDFQISTVAYTPEGQLFVAGCRDGKIRIWDSSTGRLSQTLSGHGSDVRAVAVSPQGNWLASGDQSGEVRLWSISDGESSEILSNYCAPISSLAFSGDGQTVAVATAICPKNQVLDSQPAQIAHATDETGCRGLVAFWNLLDRVEIKQIKSYSPLAVVAFSLDSNSLSGAEWSGRVLTWNIGSTELLTTRFIDRKVVAAAAFASDGQTIRPKL